MIELATSDWQEMDVLFTRTQSDWAGPTDDIIEAGGEGKLVAECTWTTRHDESGWHATVTPPLPLLSAPEWTSITEVIGPYLTETEVLRQRAYRLTAALVLANRAATPGLK